MKKINTKGFSPVYVLLAILVVGFVGFAGWRVYDSSKTKTQNATTPIQANTSNVAPINNSADLNKASQSLDSANVDGDLNSADIEKDLNTIL